MTLVCAIMLILFTPNYCIYIFIVVWWSEWVGFF